MFRFRNACRFLLTVLTLVAATIQTVTTFAEGQGGGSQAAERVRKSISTRTTLGLVSRNTVQKELKISPEQSAALDALFEQYLTARAAYRDSARALTQEESKEKRDEMRQQIEPVGGEHRVQLLCHGSYHRGAAQPVPHALASARLFR